MENRLSSKRSFCRRVGDIPEFYIPPAFIAEHGVFFPQNLTLQVDHEPRSSWPVKIIQDRDGHCKLSTANWKKFVKDNRINFSDTVVFSFADNSRVVVAIYDSHGCKAEHYCHPPPKFTFIWENRMRNCMLIRRKICNELGLEEEAEVKVRNMDGCDYVVKLFRAKRGGDGRVGLGQGWARFVNESDMVEDKMYQFKCSRGRDGKIVLQLGLIGDHEEFYQIEDWSYNYVVVL